MSGTVCVKWCRNNYIVPNTFLFFFTPPSLPLTFCMTNIIPSLLLRLFSVITQFFGGQSQKLMVNHLPLWSPQNRNLGTLHYTRLLGEHHETGKDQALTWPGEGQIPLGFFFEPSPRVRWDDKCQWLLIPESRSAAALRTAHSERSCFIQD